MVLVSESVKYKFRLIQSIAKPSADLTLCKTIEKLFPSALILFITLLLTSLQ